MTGRPRRDCELAPYVDGFRRRLLSLGYTPGTVTNELAGVGRLGRWLSDRGQSLGDMGLADGEAFIADRCRDVRRHSVSRGELVRLRQYLMDVGAIPPDPPSPRNDVDELIGSYCGWLLDVRGLSAATVRRYQATARRFLVQRPAGVDLSGLTSTEVGGFLLAISTEGSVGAAKGHVAEIRSLLRFAFLTGRTPLALAAAVPPVAGWHDTGIPPQLPASMIEALLDSCSRSTPIGIRDRAIMLLLARLGLRSIEVARLRLEDLHWRVGEVTIRGKSRRLDRLPLPVDAGEAIADYLVQARQQCELRMVFLTCRAPRRPITSGGVGGVVKQACIRVGVPVVGPHRLRHALATGMVANGVALSDVSQVLRHRDLATTAIYAKIDLESLLAVARPWPGVDR